MKFPLALLPALLLALPAFAQEATPPDVTARFLAGLPVRDTPLRGIEPQPGVGRPCHGVRRLLETARRPPNLENSHLECRLPRQRQRQQRSGNIHVQRPGHPLRAGLFSQCLDLRAGWARTGRNGPGRRASPTRHALPQSRQPAQGAQRRAQLLLLHHQGHEDRLAEHQAQRDPAAALRFPRTRRLQNR